MLLSHHPEDELQRTYRVGRVHLCARCLGTYPTLFVFLWLQAEMEAPLSSWADVPAAVVLITPALLDWAVGRFRPHLGTNLWRSFTGILLGVGLSRSLFIHFQSPFPPALLAQMVWVTAVGGPVMLVHLRGKRTRDDR